MTTLLEPDLEAQADAATETVPTRSRPAAQLTFWRGTALFGMIAVVNLIWWMGAYNYRTLTGDDLWLYIASNTPGGYASTIGSAITDGTADKWRPIPAVMLAVTTDVFGSDYMRYKLFNVLLLSLVCLLVAVLVLGVTGGRWLIAGGAALAVMFSRFNSFFVLQGIGMMESASLVFVLLALIAFQRAYATERRAALVAANVSFLLATLCHERYLFLLPFAFLATAWAPVGFRSLRDRASWAVLPVAVVVFNYLAKVWWIQIDFTTGAGGTELELSPGMIARFVRSAFLNNVGYNTGPDYLSGRDAAAIGSAAVWLCLALAIPAGIAVVWALSRDWPGISSRRIDAFRPYVLALALYLPLLLSASVAFRQEYRWLYGPFCILVVGVAWAISRLPRTAAAAVLGVTILAASLSVDVYYRQYVDNTYFFAGQRTNDSIAGRMIDQYRSELDSTSLVLVTAGRPDLEFFFLADGRYFDVYARDADVDWRFVETAGEVTELEGLRPVVRIFEWRGDSVVNIGGSAF